MLASSIAAASSWALEIPVVDKTDIRFSRLSTEDGLSQTRVAHLAQDDRGFLWFGTQSGLNRFDGYKFKVFVHDPQRPDSLGGVYVSALFKDRDGKLWIGCSQFLDCMDPVTEKFTHYKIDGESATDLAVRVVSISQDPEGMIWLASGTGLHRLDPHTGEVRHYRHDPADPATIASNDVKSTGVDREGVLWVGTNEGLDAFDGKTGKVTHHVAIADVLHIGFYEDRAGLFWIHHTSGSGLALYDRATHQLTPVTLEAKSPASGPALTGVRAMLEDNEGQLWLGTFGSGMLRYDRENRRFVRYRNNPADSESLADDHVVALFKDREGNIWTGLHASGPNHFSTRPPRFEQFRRDPSNPNGLTTNFIDAFHMDRRGRLWIGTDDALIRVDRKTGEYTRFSAGLDVKPTIVSIAEDRNGTIWIGTYRHGLARLDETTGRFTVYRHRADDPASLSNDAVHRVYVDRQGTLWAGTNDGLNRFDPARDRFDIYKVDAANHWGQCYVTIVEDAAGDLWLGSAYSGLHRFTPATGAFTVYKATSGNPGSIADDTVPAVYPDDHGAIWVGTQMGLERFDVKRGTFSQCLDAGAQLGRSVGCILPDRRGHLWMSTNKGLSEYDPVTKQFRHYSAADGLPGNDLTGWEAGCVGADGEMFFGGFDGGVAFYPEAVSNDPFVPQMELTDFRLPYAPKSSDVAAQLSKGIYPANKLTLAHDENSFSLEFAALSYFNSKTNRYRYKLEGLADRWNEVGSYQRTATFTTLPAGSYVFRAQGATARGAWSEPGIVFRVEVLQPWWQTWWFQLLTILFSVAVLVAVIRGRINRARQRERDFRALADNAPDMVMRFGRDGRLVYANSATETYVGFICEVMRGKTIDELAQLGPSLPVSTGSVLQVMRENSALVYETTCASGRGPRHFESRLVPELDPHGVPKSVLAITRDITDQKHSEASLRETRDELARVARVITVGELTASIAHEVNQPLAAIVTNGQACLRWLNRDVPDLPEIRTSVEQMVRDGIRGSEVVSRIRALLRKETPVRQPIDLNEVLREITAMISMPAGGPTLRLELTEPLPPVLADRIQLQQVILNLVGNAIEAMAATTGRAKRLRVHTAATTEQGVLVEVIDSGPGVSDGQLQKLFEPFYTTKPEGLGMGLAICRSIIESHGGKLWAEPNVEGGMTFRFTLPGVPVATP